MAWGREQGSCPDAWGQFSVLDSTGTDPAQPGWEEVHGGPRAPGGLAVPLGKDSEGSQLSRRPGNEVLRREGS